MSSSGFFGTGPYFDAFDVPPRPSWGERRAERRPYYSFDHGDIHFIVLDSQSPAHRVANSPMATWLNADLAAKPGELDDCPLSSPGLQQGFSRLGHRADPDRHAPRSFLPALEAGGVDLVLTGHSHSYERSFFVDGHYGSSTSLTPAMLLDLGDGDPDGDGAYRKNAFAREPHRGAVFLAMGNAGSIATGPLNHPIMVTSQLRAGSVVVDVVGGRLEGRFLDSTGTVRDRFVIEKNTECNDGGRQ